MKVIELKSENFKKLEAVDVILDGKTVTVQGPNGAGKSSFIDAVWIALTGKEVPPNPIKTGEKKASIEVTVRDEDGSEFIAEKIFHEKRPNQLVVRCRNEDGRLGKPERSPQGFLESRLGKISFDPFDFIKKTPKDQKIFLMDLLGLDFSQLDDKKAVLLEDKNEEVKKVRSLETKLDTMPRHGDEFKEKKDMSEIMAEADTQHEAKQHIEKMSTAIEQLKKDQESRAESLDTIAAEIKALEESRAKVNLDIESTAKEIELETNSLVKYKESQAGLLEKDLKESVVALQEHNAKAQQYMERENAIKEIRESSIEIEKYDEEIKEIEEKRKLVIASSAMPDPNLSFSDEGLLYEGLPFTEEQLSHAKVIEVGIGIQMALNPRLKIMRVKDASMCDSKTLKTIKDLAQGKGYQLFIEKVADTDSIGFIIEEDQEGIKQDEASTESQVKEEASKEQVPY